VKRKSAPSYLPHKQSGRGRAVWTDANGDRHERLLPGKFESEESRTAHARLLLELATSPAATIDKPETLTVNEVMVAFKRHAERFYAGDGGKEFTCMMHAIKPVRELYGPTPVLSFGPLALKAVRQRMIDGGLCRGLINRRVNRVRRVFKWAVAEELVPASIHEALRTVEALRKGKTEARESKPVKPVAEAVVKATLPHLPPHVRALVEMLWHTGMRPGDEFRGDRPLLRSTDHTSERTTRTAKPR
jgi:integrase